MGFKEDEKFARNLTLGAYAADAVARDLEQCGHRIVELERGAKGNKLWAINVKRLRLPDLLCIHCGRRFESRGKSKLEIKLSHSNRDGRKWHEGGMRLNDVFAFVKVAVTNSCTNVGQPVYVTRAAAHNAEDFLVAGGRKAHSEGSESDVSWPAWAPSYSGTVVSIGDDSLSDVDTDTGTPIQVKKDDGKVRTYKAKWPEVYCYRKPGESFGVGDLVAGCVAPAEIACDGAIWDWQQDLQAIEQVDRYAAIKAARFLNATEAEPVLRVLAEGDDDWRIRLEAAASLTTIDPERWIHEIGTMMIDGARSETQMEAVFVLSELEHVRATETLVSLAEPANGLTDEVRAAAVWGLGLGARPSPVEVARFLDDSADSVAMHSAAALPDPLPDEIRDLLVSWLYDGHIRRSPVAAQVLASHRYVDELIEVATIQETFGSRLALRALGDLLPDEVEQTATKLKDNVRSLLQAIWVQHEDWLRKPENDGKVYILEQQKIGL